MIRHLVKNFISLRKIDLKLQFSDFNQFEKWVSMTLFRILLQVDLMLMTRLYNNNGMSQ